MFKWLQFSGKSQQLKKSWMTMAWEIDKNLEAWHVMDQIGRQRPFQMEKFAALSDGVVPPSVERYADAVISYNQALTKCREYESWYASDAKNKTKDNARILHEKIADVKAQLQSLRDVIESASKDIRLELDNKGWLKNEERLYR